MKDFEDDIREEIMERGGYAAFSNSRYQMGDGRVKERGKGGDND